MTVAEVDVELAAFLVRVIALLVTTELLPRLTLVGDLAQTSGANSPVKPFTVVLTETASEGAAASSRGPAIREACRHLVSRGWECFKKLLVRVGCVMDGTGFRAVAQRRLRRTQLASPLML